MVLPIDEYILAVFESETNLYTMHGGLIVSTHSDRDTTAIISKDSKRLGSRLCGNDFKS